MNNPLPLEKLWAIRAENRRINKGKPNAVFLAESNAEGEESHAYALSLRKSS